MSGPNAEQIEYWNGPGAARWVAGRDRLDRNLAMISEALMEFAAPAQGARVLDVGCGCGTTSYELHRRTGAAVLGVDISQPMLDVATAGAPAGVEFACADASHHAFEPRFDLVFSRFGVMFFADPIAAFANLKKALAPGGRLAFACWRALADNPWAAVPLGAARSLLPPPPAMDPHAPGPFAFADATRLRGILERAGCRDVEVRRHDAVMRLAATPEQAADEAIELGPVARLVVGLDDATRARIRERIAAALAPHASAAGVAPGTAVWLVGAR